ncbi:MAG: DUF1795 domain-containing protein [Clostridiales bacterium]|nr:DUF1795 domain-containing protein [Clostridiales bacterium]
MKTTLKYITRYTRIICITCITCMTALLLALALSSCTARLDGAPDGMKLISTDDVEYYLYVPQSWTEDISTGVVTAYVSEKDRSNISMAAFETGDSSMTAAAFWEKYEADLTATFPDAVFGETENTVVDGSIAAEQHTFTATVTGYEYEFMETVFVRGGTAYILTYTSTPESFDSHLDDVRSVISSLKFR